MNTQLFSGKANSYEEGRPEISHQALNYLYSILPTSAVFAEVGAGTGKFTSLIAERGNYIYAVEPNEEMRCILAAKLNSFQNVRILDTCAESTHIPPNSVDVVVAVTALHWFDFSAFKKECLRILKQGGMVIAIYNSRESEWRKVLNDPSATTKASEFFEENCEIVEFPNAQYYSHDKFIAYHLSHSSTPRPEDSNYMSVIENLNSKFAQNNINGRYVFDFITIMYISKNFKE